MDRTHPPTARVFLILGFQTPVFPSEQFIAFQCRSYNMHNISFMSTYEFRLETFPGPTNILQMHFKVHLDVQV
jgi:hypothetical protein